MKPAKKNLKDIPVANVVPIQPEDKYPVGHVFECSEDESKALTSIQDRVDAMAKLIGDEEVRHQNEKARLFIKLKEVQDEQAQVVAAFGRTRGIDPNHPTTRYNVLSGPWRYHRIS